LLSRIEAAKWAAFVHGKMQSALSSGSGMALSAGRHFRRSTARDSRDLFYKALFTRLDERVSVIGGIAAAPSGWSPSTCSSTSWTAAWREGRSLPVTGVMLYYMAFVFAGKGIAELQEARIISTHP